VVWVWGVHFDAPLTLSSAGKFFLGFFLYFSCQFYKDDLFASPPSWSYRLVALGGGGGGVFWVLGCGGVVLGWVGFWGFGWFGGGGGVFFWGGFSFIPFSGQAA